MMEHTAGAAGQAYTWGRGATLSGSCRALSLPWLAVFGCDITTLKGARPAKDGR
jgi:hypothetical protein